MIASELVKTGLTELHIILTIAADLVGKPSEGRSNPSVAPHRRLGAGSHQWQFPRELIFQHPRHSGNAEAQLLFSQEERYVRKPSPPAARKVAASTVATTVETDTRLAARFWAAPAASLHRQRVIAAALGCSEAKLEHDRHAGRGLPFRKFDKIVLYCKGDVLDALGPSVTSTRVAREAA
jgi:hypothetical protein